MGIVFVLLLYAIALTIAGGIAAVVLATAAYKLIPRSALGRRRAVAVALLFPFVCLAYAGVWFGAYAVINAAVFHRDPGLGDTWTTPLPNGYTLLMIDTTDQGTVYNPRTQDGSGSVASRDDAVFGVRELQVSGDLIFGARDSGYFGRIGQDSTIVDRYFELNTTTNTQTEFLSLDDLRKRASSEGVHLNLRRFVDVFSQYRTTWFDYASGVMLVLIPLLGFSIMVRWIWRIRRRSFSI